jgi:hypothetical protein
MRQFLFPYICACVHSGKKRPHSLAAYCSLLAHTLTIPCERPQGDCPAVHSHIHCALGGNRLAWQPNKSLFSMILWDRSVFLRIIVIFKIFHLEKSLFQCNVRNKFLQKEGEKHDH